jgi:hypothetical protein
LRLQNPNKRLETFKKELGLFLRLKNKNEQKKVFIPLFTRKTRGRNMKKLIGLMLPLLILSLFTGTGNALLRNVYLATINAEGMMTLKPLNFTFPMEANFTALVPNATTQGPYDATFRGRAIVYERPIIKFDGVLNVSGNIFWVKFGIDKPEGGELNPGIYGANGNLSLDIKEVPPVQLEVTWFLMKGWITSYGDNQAFGGIIANARMGPLMEQWANVHGLFALEEPTGGKKSFHAFRLVNVTQIGYEGKSLNITGLWNVYNITITHYDDEFNLNIKIMVENDSGQLDVNLDNWNFTLSIDEMNQIDGDIIFYHLASRKLFERGIPLGDFNSDGKVDIVDIGRVAKAFGATLGKSKYDFDLDVNFNFAIDIIDVATVAKDFGQEY